MHINIGRMEAELAWQGLFLLIGAATIVVIFAWHAKGLVRFARTQLKAIRDCGGMREYISTVKWHEKREETCKSPPRSGVSVWAAVIVTLIVIERDVFETAVPWHELIMVLGANSVAFTATELLEALCRKAYAKVRAPHLQG